MHMIGTSSDETRSLAATLAAAKIDAAIPDGGTSRSSLPATDARSTGRTTVARRCETRLSAPTRDARERGRIEHAERITIDDHITHRLLQQRSLPPELIMQVMDAQTARIEHAPPQRGSVLRVS